MNPDKFSGYKIRWTIPVGYYNLYDPAQYKPTIMQEDAVESQIEEVLDSKNFSDADAVIASIKAKM